MIFNAQTEWVKPTEFPDLRFCEEIAIDLETHDPDLKTMGSGSVIGKGKVVGVAVATDGYSGYFPFDHEGGGNLEKSKVIQWFTDICKTTSTKFFTMQCMTFVGLDLWVYKLMDRLLIL